MLPESKKAVVVAEAKYTRVAEQEILSEIGDGGWYVKVRFGDRPSIIDILYLNINVTISLAVLIYLAG